MIALEVRARAFLVALAAWVLAACATTGNTATVYKVRIESGDTLAAVAAKYDTTWDKIAKLNGLTPGTSIKVGTVLRVQPGPGGLVAGAPAPTPATPRRAARIARPENRNVQPANANEFTEEDIPVDGDATPPAKRKGFLFGGDNKASLSWPLHGEISSRFGMRAKKLHRGIDIRAPRGTDIVSAGKGIVEFAGRQNGYGKTVIVNHGGVKTLYGHMTTVKVMRGERVTPQTVIGTVGTSGNASGPHLHFEVRNRENGALNPLSYLEEKQLLTSRR